MFRSPLMGSDSYRTDALANSNGVLLVEIRKALLSQRVRGAF
jgi:hypothetical protein